MTDYDVVVIGAGHNGLTSAAYLAQAGLRVVVLERRSVVGGAAATEELFPGFLVDTCAHQLWGIHPAVMKDLALASFGLELHQPASCVFSPSLSGPPITLWSDLDQTVNEIQRISGEDADEWPAFVRLVGTAADFVRQLYDQPPIDAPRPGFADAGALLGLAKHFKALTKSERADLIRVLPASIAELLDERFQNDHLKGIVAAGAIHGLLQGPMAAGTAYSFFHNHAFTRRGSVRSAYYPSGGMGALANALAQSAKKNGAAIRTKAPVQSILVRDNRVVGVVLADGEEITTGTVVSSADPRHTLLTLLDTVHLGSTVVRQVKNIKFRGAMAKVHLALGELPAFVGADDPARLTGVISIAPSIPYIERAYDEAKYGGPSNQFVLDLTIPTIANPSMAPSDQHIVSALVHYVPYHLSDGAWTDAKRQTLGDRVVEMIGQYAPNVPQTLQHMHTTTPVDLENEYGLTEGNGNHGELTLDQLYFMRPIPEWSRYQSPIANLFLCGAGTHAGGGVTCAAGFNASKVIRKALKAK